MSLDHLSYSGLNTYKECGEKFRLTRVEHVPEVPGWALIGGRAVHKATEVCDWHEYTGEGDPMTFTEAFEMEIEETRRTSSVPEETWRVSGKVSKDWPNKENKNWWLWHGPTFVANWVSWRNRYPGTILLLENDTPAIELSIQTYFGEAKVTGFIDRLFREPDGSIRVIDLKAGRTIPNDPRQLAIYAWGLPENIRPVRGSYFDARRGMLIGDWDLTESKPALDYEFSGAWKSINAGYYPAKQSYMCNYCSVQDFCWAEKGELSEAVKPF